LLANQSATEKEQQQIERLVMIKEASFNTASALVLAMAILGLSELPDWFDMDMTLRQIWPTALLVLVLGVLVFGLYYSHHKHRIREWDFRERVTPDDE
jgi:uncharacterized BrkB/YihY/UPF0761 family membrane protein